MTSSESNQPKITDSPIELTKENNLLLTVHKIWAEAYQPIEFRANVKLWGAGTLAFGLWFLVGLIAWNQFSINREYARQLADLTPSTQDGQITLVHQEKVNQIERSVAIVNSTSDRLYTFLSPVVTAITGYFFVSATPRQKIKESDSKTP